MMQCLGEMATWLPLPGAIPHFCARYVDDAMGFAVGWNNWILNALTLCSEISAASVVIRTYLSISLFPKAGKSLDNEPGPFGSYSLLAVDTF